MSLYSLTMREDVSGHEPVEVTFAVEDPGYSMTGRQLAEYELKNLRMFLAKIEMLRTLCDLREFEAREKLVAHEQRHLEARRRLLHNARLKIEARAVSCRERWLKLGGKP